MVDSLDVAEVHPTVKRWGGAVHWFDVKWQKRDGKIVVKLPDESELQIETLSKPDKPSPQKDSPNASYEQETSPGPEGTSKASVPLDNPASYELDPRLLRQHLAHRTKVETPGRKLRQASSVAPPTEPLTPAV